MQNCDGEMRRRSKTKESNSFSRLGSGHAQAAKSDDASAEQRRGLLVVDFVRKRKNEIGPSDSEFSIAAIDRVASKGRFVTQIFLIMFAIPAGAISPANPGHADARSLGEVAHLSGNNFTDNLMSGSNARPQLRQMGFDDVQIRPAHAAGANF